MKKILLIAVLLGAMLSVTVYFVCIAAPSVLFGKGLKGSGNIVTRTIEAPAFDRIDAARAVKVVITDKIGEKYKILAGSLQFADRAGGQGGAHIHQNAALQYIAAGQRQSAVNGQRCQHVQVIGCTAFVMVKGQNLGVRLQGGLQVCKNSFSCAGPGYRARSIVSIRALCKSPRPAISSTMQVRA